MELKISKVIGKIIRYANKKVQLHGIMGISPIQMTHSIFISDGSKASTGKVWKVNP